MTNAEARFNNSLRPRKPEGSLGRTTQDGHLDSHTAPELWTPAIYSASCYLCQFFLIFLKNLYFFEYLFFSPIALRCMAMGARAFEYLLSVFYLYIYVCVCVCVSANVFLVLISTFPVHSPSFCCCFFFKSYSYPTSCQLRQFWVGQFPVWATDQDRSLCLLSRTI